MTKNLILGPILAYLALFVFKFHLYYQLDIVPIYHLMQFKGKLMYQTCEKGKKPSFGPDFDLFLQVLSLLVVRHCSELSLYAFSWKTNKRNLIKWQKTQFWARFWPMWPKFGSPIFFSKIQFHQSLDVMISYHHVQYKKKVRIQS